MYTDETLHKDLSEVSVMYDFVGAIMVYFGVECDDEDWFMEFSIATFFDPRQKSLSGLKAFFDDTLDMFPNITKNKTITLDAWKTKVHA